MQEKKSPALPTSVLQRWTNLVAELAEHDAKLGMLIAAAVMSPEIGRSASKLTELKGEAKDLVGKIQGHIDLWAQ